MTTWMELNEAVGRFWTDFNDLREGSVVEADLEDAEYFVDVDFKPGVAVDLFDGEGHECRGWILAMDVANRSVEVKIDWASWRSLHTQQVRMFVGSSAPLLTFETSLAR